MVREFVGAVMAVSVGGCSLALDFSAKAIPKDAPFDAPYNDEECAYLEPNNTPQTAAAITPADMGPAAICANADGTEDDDYYTFTVPVATASVTVRIDFTDAIGDLDLRLFDSTGQTLLAQSRGIGDNEIIVCPGASPFCAALAPADYVFEVFPAVAGAVNSYTISLTITPM